MYQQIFLNNKEMIPSDKACWCPLPSNAETLADFGRQIYEELMRSSPDQEDNHIVVSIHKWSLGHHPVKVIRDDEGKSLYYNPDTDSY